MDTESQYRPRRPAPPKSGQALVEFCIGLVGMLAVIGGIFQLGLMGRARTDARVEATRSATALSMLDEDLTGVFLPRYIRRMDAGGDNFTYSVDDFAVSGNTQDAYDRVASRMRPGQVRPYAPGSEIALMGDPVEMLMGMGLVSGVGMELNVPVLPVARRLFFNRGTVDFQAQVWMTRTGDLY